MILIIQIALGIVLAVFALAALVAWAERDRPPSVDKERAKALAKEDRLQFDRDHPLAAKVRRNIWWILPIVVAGDVALVAFLVWLFGGI